MYVMTFVFNTTEASETHKYKADASKSPPNWASFPFAPTAPSLKIKD